MTATKKPTKAKQSSVWLSYEGPDQYLYEPETGQTVAAGTAFEVPSSVADRLQADPQINVTVGGAPT